MTLTVKWGWPVATATPEGERTMQSDSNTPRLVFSARCQGADIKRLFAILLRQYGNVSIGEVG